jgi:polysaccharide export outer membrane protein
MTRIPTARLWIVLFALLTAATSFAQLINGTYRLQREDVIRIFVYREDSLSSEVVVGEDGNITVPFIGNVRAVGKTTTELAAELESEYVRQLKLKNPKITVSVVRYRAIQASSTGMLRSPGSYSMRNGDTIMTLLSKSGGPDIDRADLRRATLRRAGSDELIPIDLYSMLIMADTTQNYQIQDGDILNVPEKVKPTISVAGAVPSPGALGFREGMTVADALAFSRWEIKNRSMLSKTTVLRETPGQPGRFLRIQVDMVRFLREGDASQNILLQPGDIVWVPDTKTPDFDRIATIAGTLFYLNRFFNGEFFGFRLFGTPRNP